MYICQKCNKTFKKRHAYIGHCSSHSRGESYKDKRETPRSAQRRANSVRQKICKYCQEIFDSGTKLGGHYLTCKLNPNVEKIKEARSFSLKGKKKTDEQKKNISDKMKKAHAEGRAWNIGKSRWNNEESYPESFFKKVILNEFLDKNFVQEYPVGIYSIDFAWPDKKKGIEIDGEQHQRFEEYRLRDKRKDEFLFSEGWKILRVQWKDMHSETKKWIEETKKFID